MSNSVYFKNYLVKDVFLFTILTFINLLTHETLYGSLISIPQFIFILFLIFTNRTEKAFKYHIIFTLTCLAIPFSQIIEPGAKEYGLYNYSKFKLFGPVGVFHIISILFFIFTFKKKLNFSGLNLFGLLYKVLLILAVIGIIFGIIGLLFFDYYFQHFITYSVYMFVIITHLIVLAKYNSPKFLNRIFQIIIALLISAPFASFILNLLGITTYYGNNKVSVLTEVAYYSVFLIFS